jgi:RHS repeat-associated protein
MGRSGKRILGLAAFLAATTCLTGVAFAQAAAPAVRSTIDANGVDLTTGTFQAASPGIVIGKAGAGGLSFNETWDSSGTVWRHPYQVMINSSNPGSTADTTVLTVSVGGSSETFVITSGAYVNQQGTGSTLSLSSGVYTYTTDDGTVVTFSHALTGLRGVSSNEALATSLTRPNHEAWTWTYNAMASGGGYRLQSVTNNLGYQVHLEYNDGGGANTGFVITKAVALNNAVDYCSPSANSCSFTKTWPSLTISGSSTFSFTDANSHAWTYANGTTFVITRPTSGTLTYAYNGSGLVSSVANGTGTWSYGYSTASGILTTTVTDPLSHTRVVAVDTTTGLVSSDTDGNGHATSYAYDGYGRLTQVTRPEGDETQLAYDGRGNVTTTTVVPKSGSGLSNIVTSASYDSTCTTNFVKCNQPNSTTDALGNQTDYTYDTTHGGVLTVTAPAPTTGAVRPKTTVTYTALTAHYKNSGGSIVAAGSSVYLPTGISTCQTTSSCSGGSDEVATSITYGSTTTSVANNLLPTSISKGAGDASLTATTAITYTDNGDIKTVDGPLSGSTDTMTYRYDDTRQLSGMVAPDPDGGGALKNRATRITRDNDGQVTLVERGTVNSAADADWSGFTTIDQAALTYDSVGRKTKISLASGGTTYQVAQYSWDNANRPDCTAVRMNPSVFGSLPSSACSLGTTGSNGPDRITRNTYDAADQVTKVTEGYASGSPRDIATLTYGSNGETATLADGLGQLTTYEHDGVNRLVKTRYPNPTTPTSSSTTDYEAYAYDAASNRTQLTRRGGDVVSYSYDHLSRLVTITPPTGQAVVTLAFDNLSRQTSASFSGHTLTNSFDALSRLTSQAGPLGTVSYQYDLAGRRTRMTWPDSLYVAYDYDADNEVTAMRENGAGSGIGVLATFTYDNVGRRTGLTRGNGVSTTYSYNGASDLTGIAHDLTGTTYDQTLTYTYNAAGQVLTRAGSNSSYGWAGATNLSRAYTADGQNKYTAIGAASYSYDGRGNLSSDGTNSFGYDSFNRLTSGPSSATLSYDPMSRLYQTVGGGVTTKMQYDGVSLIGEYNSGGTLQRRYVHGPGTDEPLVWYEGSGTTDRRWLISDQLGSVIGVTDASGASTAINTYDDYGVPGGSNAGRFQYTGQAWVPEVGLYHDKARAYSPTIGRFMQTDPVGMAGGVNLYSYVRNSPISARDPLGLTALPTEVAPVTVTAWRCGIICKELQQTSDIAQMKLGMLTVAYYDPRMSAAIENDPEKKKACEAASAKDAKTYHNAPAPMAAPNSLSYLNGMLGQVSPNDANGYGEAAVKLIAIAETLGASELWEGAVLAAKGVGAEVIVHNIHPTTREKMEALQNHIDAVVKCDTAEE